MVFVIYGIDKHRAAKCKRRIRERTLIICALALGAYGAITGMVVFNHKTSKAKFRFAVPLLFVSDTALLVWYACAL